MPFVIIIIVIVLAYQAYLKTPKAKGIKGEKMVGAILKKAALTHGGIELWDWMVQDDQAAAQVDNLLLTQKALYVFEVKNYRGRIFGSPTQLHWTMTLLTSYTKKTKRGKRVKKTHLSKHRFYNPIMQNQTHIRKLTHVLEGTPTVPIINVVVFGSKADVSEVSSIKEVVSYRHLMRLIDQYEASLEVCLSIEDQIDVVDRLYEADIRDKKARRAHVKNLRLKYKN